MAVRGEVSDNKTSLAPPLYITVPVATQECYRSCICALRDSMLPLFVRFVLLDIGTDGVV